MDEKKLFDTECGNMIATSALKINILEKNLLKNGKASDVLKFYNRIYALSMDYQNDLELIEQELLNDKDGETK